MTNPFFSKAIFSWNVPGVDGGDPNKFADRLKAAGIEAVYLKMANGAVVFKPSSFAYPMWGENVKPTLIDALRARGIKVIGWQFNYGDNTIGEADVAIAQTKRFNLDGWIFDVEGKFESNPAAVTNAYTLTLRYREGCPTTPLAFCSWAQWRSPSTDALWHNEKMARAFMESCDVGMPMMYWEGSRPETAVWLLKESLRLWRNITIKPIVPVGRAYTGDGGTINALAVKAFADEARTLKLPGLSWWVLDSAIKDTATWGAIGAIPPIAEYTVYLPVIIAAPDPHIAQLETARNEMEDVKAGLLAARNVMEGEIQVTLNKFNELLVAQLGEIDYIINTVLKG